MNSKKILIIEDDKNISKLLKYNLEKSDYNCYVAISGEDAFEILDKEKIDLIILDIMLPKMDGFEICRIIKQEPKLKNIPIIMLTAKGEEIDRIVGFELGADDYVVKPFSPRELILRIKAILKRTKTQEKEEILNFGILTVDIPKHIVKVNEKEIKLTPIEFKLLTTLMERKGRVQSREVLLNDVWNIYTEVSTRTVDAHIKKLREKLGKAAKFIETVAGIGYKFKVPEDED